ncbi:FAD-binding oxidoreductase [Candidatus Villigracilis saccharophilus]|uniref:NAD(P)/FAD-dependent oxidoreductase n=1 Tax=Candidatus Villigracilis saccharophilus TaxID=3140684 RepID=UPI003135100A|nr:FAD-binding oxidoreductase [Anaerolineales bacterium]
MTKNFDAIVIGAGVIGISTAFHLAQRGLKPVILERKEIGYGATGKSSGLVRMHYDLEVESRLAWESFQYFRNWSERVGGECGFCRTGFLHIETADHEVQLRKNVEMHQKIGIPANVISGGDVKKLAPHFKTDDIAFAAYEPESGYADPMLTANSLLTAAKDHGAIYVQDCEVSGTQTAGGKVTGLQTSRGNFSAPIIINAAGAWAGKVSELFGVTIPLGTWTHDVVHIRRPAQIADHLTVIDNSLNMYFRPDSGNLTLVALEDDSRLDEPAEEDLGYVAKDFVERAIDRICKRVPEMEQGSLHSSHVGRDGLTPDQRAIIGAAGPQGYFLATGFSGTGFKLSPAVGLCMSELILDGRSKTVDISGFDPMRFERGQYLKGENEYGSIWK